MSTDPDGADQWAESISDPQLVRPRSPLFCKNGCKTDPTSASVAVQKSSLPANIKNQILQPPQ